MQPSTVKTSTFPGITSIERRALESFFSILTTESPYDPNIFKGLQVDLDFSISFLDALGVRSGLVKNGVVFGDKDVE